MSNFLVALAVFVITVVGALFTVPHFIDWNGYRGIFEEEATRLLGREVRVGGSVNLHLLPTPYFRFEKVRIANTSANLDEPFFRADSLTIKLAVPPLLKGAVEANEIEFQRPILRLAPNDKGGWNWQSFGQALGNAPYLPTNVALASLRIKDGVLAVHGTNGVERVRFEGLEGELSSPALDGPYRFRGTYTAAGAEREIRVSTGKAEGDGSVRVRATLRLADVGSVYNLDGRLIDLMGKARMDGELTARLPVGSIWQTAARPNTSTRAKGAMDEPKSGDVAFDLKAAVTADAAGATLSDLALSFEQEGRPQLMTGDVKATWRDALAVDIKLASGWLDLDRLAGAPEDSSPLESLIPLAIRLRDLLPADSRSRASFTVDQANIARETISGVRLSLVRSSDKLEVEELRLGMPGGSRGELQGVVSGPANAPVFDGNLGVRGASVVRFLGWARGTPLPPDTKGDGTFGVRSQLNIAAGQMVVRDIVGDLSGTSLYGEARYRWEGRPELTLSIEGPQIDVRPFVPQGASLQGIFNLTHAATAEPTTTAGSMLAKKAGHNTPTDALIRVNAGQLITAGRIYRDVALEFENKGGRLRIPLLRLSGEEGYTLELEGEVDDVAGRPKGSIRAAVAADSQQGLLPLAELLGIPDAFRPGERRLQGLAPLRVAGSIAFGGRTATSADITLDGEANNAAVKATARLDGSPAGWRKGAADLTGSIDGADAGRIVAALLGTGAPAGEANRPGRILIKAGGTPADGMTTIASVDAGELALDYRGQLSLTEAGNKIAGDLEIKGADAMRVAALAGLSPPLRFDGLPISGTLKLTAGDGSLDIERLALAVGGNEVKGRLALSPAGDHRRVAAHLLVGELSVAKLLAPILDQRLALAGAAEAALGAQPSAWPDEAFDAAVLDGFEGTIRLDATHLTLASGVGLANASFDIELTPGKIDVKGLTGEGLGGRFGAQFALEKRRSGAELVAGTATFEATLEALAPPRAGAAVRATGPLKGTLEFTGRGTSPRALVAALQGKASIEVGDAKIANLWPGALGTAIEAAVKVEADRVGPTLRERLLAALPEGQLPLGPATLALDIVDGQLKSKPIVIDTEQGRASGTANLDLRTLAFDSEWRLERKRANDKIDAKAALPPVTLSYRGPVTALSGLDTRITTDALERELTARKMELDLEELERLRQSDETRRRSETERQRDQQDTRQPGSGRPALPNIPVLPKGGGSAAAPG